MENSQIEHEGRFALLVRLLELWEEGVGTSASEVEGYDYCVNPSRIFTSLPSNAVSYHRRST